MNYFIYKNTGKQSDEWKKILAVVPANISPSYHVMIKANKGGNGNDGDIAIDDYSIGSCPPPVSGEDKCFRYRQSGARHLTCII